LALRQHQGLLASLRARATVAKVALKRHDMPSRNQDQVSVNE